MTEQTTVIERIFIRAPSAERQTERESVRVLAGRGVDGDRYFDRHEEPGQNVTLVEAEAIERFLQTQGRPHDLSVTGRNLVTRGVRLNDLLGQTFRAGGVTLRGVELCEPCLGLGKALASETLKPADVVKAFLHCGGLRADVVTDGVISVGDLIQRDATAAAQAA